MKSRPLSYLKLAILSSIIAILATGNARGAIADEESRILLERILAAHQTQNEALCTYQFSADWVEQGADGGTNSETTGRIHHIQQGDRNWFSFASTHDARNTPMGDGHYEFETRGVENGECFATWSRDRVSGKVLAPKWFERAPDGTLPPSTFGFDYALRIQPLKQAMGPGGQSLQALVDAYANEDIVITCREIKTAAGEARISVSIDLPKHQLPGTWANLLINPAKGCLVEESTVTGRDGTELSRAITLTEVAAGVWFPKEIALNTNHASPTSPIRTNRFTLLDFSLGEPWPEEQFTLHALEVPAKILSDLGVARYYHDGRIEVTTIDGREHLGKVKRAEFFRE